MTPAAPARPLRPDLAGQRVLVVGGGSKLGAAIARAALEAGADVVVAGRDRGALEAVSGGAMGTALVDLADPPTIRRLADEVGTVDHLVSTVSMHTRVPLAELSDDAIQLALDAKVLGPIRLARATIGRVTQSLTFFSGVAAERPPPEWVVPATVNGALNHLVKALAVELQPVRVNAVAPGTIDSGSHNRYGDAKAAFLEGRAAATLAGRVGEVEDVVGPTLALLASPYITGQTLTVDGGALLT